MKMYVYLAICAGIMAMPCAIAMEQSGGQGGPVRTSGMYRCSLCNKSFLTSVALSSHSDLHPYVLPGGSSVAKAPRSGVETYQR